jgi:hypothetical protein
MATILGTYVTRRDGGQRYEYEGEWHYFGHGVLWNVFAWPEGRKADGRLLKGHMKRDGSEDLDLAVRNHIESCIELGKDIA